MTAETSTTSEAVLNQHLQAIFARDVDAIVRDYAEDAVFFMFTDTFRGRDQIRAAFIAILNLVTPEVMSQMKLSHQQVHGEFAYILWSAGSHITLATDTFCVRGGKIIMQSFAGTGPLFGS